VVKDHDEVLNCLLEWEKDKDPAAAHRRARAGGTDVLDKLVNEEGNATMLAIEVNKEDLLAKAGGKKKGGGKKGGGKKGGALGGAAAKAAAGARAAGGAKKAAGKKK
jgi:hypothetical protein